MGESIKLVDTTIRDGQASLWAMNMRTAHMLPIMPHLDAAGFDSMEFIATGSRFKKFVRHLGENPWDWIDLGARLAEHTPLRWHGVMDGLTMSGWKPPEIGELLVEKAVARGIRLNRISDYWNDFSTMADDVARFERLGMQVVVNIVYSVSPVHTDDYFVERARELARIRPYRICLKDVGGLLTPERARDLLPRMLAVTGDVPWEFHGHCNNGLGPLNAVEAAKAGVRYIHTAVPPLANGSSQPSVYTVTDNLRQLGFEVDIDLGALRPVTEFLTGVARREGLPIGVPAEYEERLYAHQVPGGMISNLKYQLELAGLSDRIDEVLDEAARVRADFGYPIMITPLSQFVGSQAAVNVIVGERYKQVTDETIEYALGRHGGANATEAMDPGVRERILDRPRAKEVAAYVPPKPTLAELRERYDPDLCDEDLILKVIVGDDATDVVGSARDARSHVYSDSPVVQLVKGLIDSERDAVSVERDDCTVRIVR